MMKLIDLLVRELPKRGGWPEGVTSCQQSAADRELYFHGLLNICSGIYLNEFADDNLTSEITHKQYETALAASVWNGEGLPPVGCECEWKDDRTNLWVKVKVVYASEWFLVIQDEEETEVAVEIYGGERGKEFRPTQAEAEHKRHEFTAACVRLDNSQDWSYSMAYFGGLYDAIAAGKIPGVKLTD